MKSKICKVGLAVALSGILLVPCKAQDGFQIFTSGTSDTAATVSPGGVLTLDVAATSITGNLDSFTYRITFPNQDFVLLANTFAAPFDNTLAPFGNNGSVPWSGLPLTISDSADAGTPGYTALAPDVYRTTATTTGTGVTGNNIVLETLTLQVPSPVAETSYPISLNILEAADNTGALMTTTSGTDFVLTVVPEPATRALVAAGLVLCVFLRWLVKRG